MAIKTIEQNLTKIERNKNYQQKFRILDNLYGIIDRKVLELKSDRNLDIRDLQNISKSLESVIKVEYMLDSEVALLQTDEPTFNFG